MALDAKLVGSTSGTGAEVAGTNQLKVIPEVNVSANPGNVGGVKFFSENDDGSNTGAAQLLSPETDLDYRLRAASDCFLDQEIFNYAAQNTGKYQYATTTLTTTWGTGGMVTNGGGITTTTTGAKVQSYAFFPIVGTSTLALDIEGAFNTTPTTFTVIDFGLFLLGAANPYAPTDGVYFRLTSAGLVGVVNFNGTETLTSVMALTIVPNKKYQFIIYVTQRLVEFWINDGTATLLYGTLTTPVGNAQPCMSAALPFSVRHAIVGGAASASMQFTVGCYNVRIGGPNIARTLGEMGNAAYGSYQGLSGGTMGSLANFQNSTNPTAAVPTGTTAALGTGLGGQFWETDTLAVTTDGIICSYQVPAATVNVQGRRLKITGLHIESFVQTALTGGGYNACWSLAFGHTALSIGTAEGVASKAPRRIPLGVQTVPSAAAALLKLEVQDFDFDDGPIYVNPGEFVAVVKKKVGTAPTAGVIAHQIQFRYAWE